MNQKVSLVNTFKIPAIVLLGIVLYILLEILNLKLAAVVIAVLATLLGSYRLFYETATNILKKQFALDYIAILAIAIALATQEYLVAEIVALMIASGRTLEDYGVAQAKKSLTKLAERIPNEVFLWERGKMGSKVKIDKIKKDDEIIVRKGEVIALDGVLVSEDGLTDESSLTGEPYEVEKIKNDPIRSGTVNVGDSIVVKVTKEAGDSSYAKIVAMVKRAQGKNRRLSGWPINTAEFSPWLRF